MTIQRRLFGGMALALLPGRGWAEGGVSDDAVAAAIRTAIGDVEPVEGGIELRLPALAENGAQVPLSVLVYSPMTADDHVSAIHVFATANPTPGVASFHLFPGLARAEIQTRIRVAQAQSIIVVARHSDGRVQRTSARLSVTRGGCLS